MKRLVREHLEFFQQYRQTFQTTGALAPSSRYLARALARPIERHHGPARILEVGPGTGAVTRRIVKLLKPEDQLDLVELNDTFVEVLRRRLRDDPDFQTAADRVKVHHLAIQQFQTERPYDFIVSGLPFTNFSPELVREIFGVLFRLLAPQGVLTYFEYQHMRTLKRAFSGSAARQKI
ncbi:MAG: methyltransferase domain-containing protein, partial [Planctomycetaceae bacterium]